MQYKYIVCFDAYSIVSMGVTGALDVYALDRLQHDFVQSHYTVFALHSMN
jgi:hypothetical protein